jgi:hypothetical protein
VGKTPLLFLANIVKSGGGILSWSLTGPLPFASIASLARQSPDPTADDDHLRSRIIDALGMKDWRPQGLGVIVRDDIVHLSGIITDERSKKVHDHLCLVDPMSGLYFIAPDDEELAKAS